MIKMRTMTLIYEMDDALPTSSRILELPVLLPAWQVSALERRAHRDGQTVGQLLRRLIGDFLDATPQCQLEQASSNKV